MKYRNKETGVILEPRSEAAEKQLAKDERFELVKDEPKKQIKGAAGQ